MRRQALETAVCNDPQFTKNSVGPRQHTSLEVKELLNAFPQLPPEQREAMFLIVAEGLSYEQAASICGCAVGTIKSRIGRARKALQAEFEGNQPERRPARPRARIRHAPVGRAQQQAETMWSDSDE
jgi:DNA-directed RNA polymerase specialized sigma24 family protein